MIAADQFSISKSKEMCLRNYGTHLVTFLTQDDVNDLRLLCNNSNSNSNSSCWIGYNDYYSSDGEWYRIMYIL